MGKFYTLSESDHIGIVVERPRKRDTAKAFRTAINDHFDCDCVIPSIDFDKCKYGESLTVNIEIGESVYSIGVSETSLY